MSDLIINTKLHRPVIHGVYAHRQRLLDQLDQHGKHPLTLISAPAGYGKGVLIRSWLESCNIPSVWLSLD